MIAAELAGEGTRPWHGVWPAHVPRSMSYPAAPAWWLLEKNVSRYSGREAIKAIDYVTGAEQRSVTYMQLWDLACRVAGTLRSMGVQPGDRVALYLANSPELIASYYGAWLAGAVGVPCNTMCTARELAHQVRDAGARLILCSPELRTITEGLGLSVISDFEHLSAPLRKPAAVDPARDLALLLYTGGTTGSPKGAMLTHANIVANTHQFATWYAFAEGDERCISVLPLFHSGGMAGAMNVPLSSGATLLLMQRFSPRVVAATIGQYGATRFFGVPTMYVAILNDDEARRGDFSSLRACRTSAAPLPEAVKSAFDELAGREILIEGYGLSEASPLTHANPLQRPKSGSIGIPLADTDARIVDESGHDVAPGQEGEILLRGPQVMQGYWRKPAETKAALKDGWLLTGDIGRIDEEGYFSVVDRKKDCIISGGFKVWPREVEEVLYMHTAVRLCAVVSAPDQYRGEAVKACVVLKPGESLGAEELRTFCRRHLASYKVPRLVAFLDELPTSGAGKILRRALRESAAS